MSVTPVAVFSVAMFLVLIGADLLVRQRRAAGGARQSVLYVGVLMLLAGLVCGCWSIHPLLHALLD